MPERADRFALGISNCRPVREIVAAVQEAERRGAELAFIAEDVNCRDAFQICTACALGTERIRLATGVVNPYTRNPTALAMAIATLDEVSAGRAVLGLGTSSPSLIQGQMGISVGKPVGVMRETTEIVRALLGGERVSYRGARFTYLDARLEVTPTQQHIPIYFAAMGPLMLRLAGRIADGVLLNVGASVSYIRWAVEHVRMGAREASRSPDEVTIAAWLTAYITDDYEKGLQRAREWLAMMLSIPRQGELLLQHEDLDLAVLARIRSHVGAYPHVGDRVAAARHVPPEIADRLTLIGSPSRVRARLEQYRRAGVQLPVLGPTALRALL